MANEQDGGWISVNDQPIPTDGTTVLVFIPTERPRWQMQAATLQDGSFPSIVGHRFAFDVGEPTHWQPLPAPPTERGRDDA